MDYKGWINVEEKLPEPETPVIAIVGGYDAPIVIELRWETCNSMVESYFKDFLYWDDPNNDGQDYQDLVSFWQPLPEMPE